MLFLLSVEIICNFVTKVLVKAFLKSLSPAYQVPGTFPWLSFPWSEYWLLLLCKEPGAQERWNHCPSCLKDWKTPSVSRPGWSAVCATCLKRWSLWRCAGKTDSYSSSQGISEQSLFLFLGLFFQPPHPTLRPCSCLLFSKKSLSHRSPQPWKPLWVKLEGDVTFQR